MMCEMSLIAKRALPSRHSTGSTGDQHHLIVWRKCVGASDRGSNPDWMDFPTSTAPSPSQQSFREKPYARNMRIKQAKNA
tara:strand:- start:793 stop:1032 length:240 start_codon:yes stop_codon:yes gene_type:complete